MFEHRSNAFVEAMNGLLQQAKRATRGIQEGIDHHPHPLLAHVNTHAPAHLARRASHAAQCTSNIRVCVRSSSMQNDEEPCMQCVSRRRRPRRKFTNSHNIKHKVTLLWVKFRIIVFVRVTVHDFRTTDSTGIWCEMSNFTSMVVIFDGDF
ncbi:MAG: hypothetical protein Q4G71_12975, partial [Pseudomonadota bacterium]|nr:hypothetical protein [Pseudomonadota bacterium]